MKKVDKKDFDMVFFWISRIRADWLKVDPRIMDNIRWAIKQGTYFLYVMESL